MKILRCAFIIMLGFDALYGAASSSAGHVDKSGQEFLRSIAVKNDGYDVSMLEKTNCNKRVCGSDNEFFTYDRAADIGGGKISSEGISGKPIYLEIYQDFLIILLEDFGSRSDLYKIIVFDLYFKQPYMLDDYVHEFKVYPDDREILKVKDGLNIRAKEIREKFLNTQIRASEVAISNFKKTGTSLIGLAMAALAQNYLDIIKATGKKPDIFSVSLVPGVSPEQMKQVQNLLPQVFFEERNVLPIVSPFRLYYVNGELKQPIDLRKAIVSNPEKIAIDPNGNYAAVVIKVDPKVDPERDFWIDSSWKVKREYFSYVLGRKDFCAAIMPRYVFRIVQAMPYKNSISEELEAFKQRPYKNSDEQDFYRERMTLLNMTPYPIYAALYSKARIGGQYTKLNRVSGRSSDEMLAPFGRRSIERPAAGFLTTEELLVAVDKSDLNPTKYRLNHLIPQEYNDLKELHDKHKLPILDASGIFNCQPVALFNSYKLGANNQGWDGLVVSTQYDGTDANKTTIEFNQPFKFSPIQ